MIEAFTADADLDISAELCPMTYVRTRLALERLAPGQILAVTLRGDDPLRNVPLSATRQGHSVLAQKHCPDGATRLWIRRGP